VEEHPNNDLIAQIMALKNASLADMRAKYQEVCGDLRSDSRNRIYLWRKIAYRLQELHYVGLSEAGQSRINGLIEKYDPANNKSLRPEKTPEELRSRTTKVRDKRLPIPGAIIRKEYKGRMLEVRVLEKGFEFEGKPYNTLSSVANAVTGAKWNGFLFFGI